MFFRRCWCFSVSDTNNELAANNALIINDLTYKFRFEIYDFYRNTRLADPFPSNQQAWVLLNDPPLLNFPADANLMLPQDPANIVFGWTPRQNSPNSAFIANYEFTLVEIYEANPLQTMTTGIANNAMLSQTPLHQETTTASSLVYDASMPLLTVGKVYAWRVQAREPLGRNLFKNNGFSEVRWFRYGELCGLVSGMADISISPTIQRLTWVAGAGHSNFKIRYRKIGGSGNAGIWVEQTYSLEQAQLTDLEANTTYEYGVKGFCGATGGSGTSANSGAWSATQSFKTAEIVAGAFVCGAPLPALNLTNVVLKTELAKGDKVFAADFDFEVTEVVKNADGSFTGKAIVELPFMQYVKVAGIFTNAKFNAESKLIAGQISIRGVTGQLLDDDVLAEINGLADQIDGFLAQADNTLEQIDQVLAIMDKVLEKMIKYLPTTLVSALSSAQKKLEDAKDKLDALIKSNASPAEIAAAQQAVKDARGEVKTAWGNALTYWKNALIKFVEILWTATRELLQEATSSESAKINARNTKLNEVKTALDINATPDNTIKSASLGKSKSVKITDNTFLAGQQTKIVKSDAYYVSKEDVIFGLFIQQFLLLYATTSSMEDLQKDFREIDFDVVDFIALQLKVGLPDAVIVVNLKRVIKGKLIKFLLSTKK